jgi:hypothetical protein
VVSSAEHVAEDDTISPSLREQTQRFLAEFLAKGEVLVRELIEENERLRASLEDSGQQALHPPTELLQRLVRKVDELEHECAEIRRLAGSMEQDAGGYRERLDELEHEHYHLAAIHVAANQFHCASSIEDVLRTITEILLNFVGVGRFTVFGVDEGSQVLFPLASESGPSADGPELPLSSAKLPGGPPWRPWKAADGRGSTAGGVLMQLPLVAGTRLLGVVRIESFLPQKQEFMDTDFGLLELISEHAGIGIETAWIRAHAKETPLERPGLERLVGA